MINIDTYIMGIRTVIADNSTDPTNAEEYEIRENNGYIDVQSPLDIDCFTRIIKNDFGDKKASEFKKDIDALIAAYNSAVSEINADMQIITNITNKITHVVLKIPLKAENLDECLYNGPEKLAKLYSEIYSTLRQPRM